MPSLLSSNHLRGARLQLTAVRQTDLPTITRWHQDADFLRVFDALPAYPKTEAQIAALIGETQKATNSYLFAIRPLDEEDLLGYLEMDGILWTHGVCGMSLAIGEPSQRGKGYGYEAMYLALTFAFSELNLHRVSVTVFSYNERSIALCEKVGFQREGVFREFIHREGQRFDMILFGLLRHEWELRSEP